MSLGAFAAGPTNPAGAPMAHGGHSSSGYANGGNRPLGGGHGAGRTYPHISDLTSVWPTDVGLHTPMRTLLDQGHAHLRQADTDKDIGRRPDAALQEYLLGSIIAIQIIPRHKDFPSLSNSQIGRLYDALKHKISKQHSTYENIKADIIRDNERTGVQPTLRGNGLVDGKASHPPPHGPGPQQNGSPPRSKPPIHPKPSSLHGNALQHGRSAAAPDLNARFANLAGPRSREQQQQHQQQQQQQQDPRIRTQPIIPLKPQGPRTMPAEQQPRLGVNSDVPDLPKMPDAIYSPARGTVSTEAGQLPSSTPRGLFSRTGSTTSFSSLSQNPPPSQPLPTPQQNGIYLPTGGGASGLASSARPSTPAKLSVSEGDTVTAQELFDLMKVGTRNSQILLIDVRPRDQFDDGHIMCRSIICIEPSVLLRENISADEIAESNVLAPAEEMAIFEKRNTFELVVFYDQRSESVPRTPVSERNEAEETGRALLSLQRALLYFNYQKDLRNPPKLLRGGLDAWIDLLGAHSLQSSSTGSGSKTTNKLASRPHETPRTRRRSQYVIKPLKPEEVKIWQETLKKDDLETAQSPDFVRSTEDFLRRFPPVSLEQESMTSPTGEGGPMVTSPRAEVPSMYSDLPSPPTRPAPAVPRPSYSGLSQRDYTDDGVKPRATARAVMGAAQASTDLNPHHYAGLVNPGNWCYANSILQSLRASRGFGGELSKLKVQNNWQVPNEPKTGIPNPQLMLRIMGNLFTWMSTGHFEALKAQTLMEYTLDLARREENAEEFGGDRQQDADEFLHFIFSALDKETNVKIDQKEVAPPEDWGSRSQLEVALEFWRQHHSPFHQSIIDRYFRGMSVRKTRCATCNTATYRPELFTALHLNIQSKDVKCVEDAFRAYVTPEILPSYDCETCKRKGPAETGFRLSRLPELLIVTLKRFEFPTTNKILKKVTFDPDRLDCLPYFVTPEDQQNFNVNGNLPSEAFPPTFDYECYAVVVHGGATLKGGHYYAYVRNNNSNEKHRWYKCNDSHVTEAELGSGTRNDGLEWVFRSKTNHVPYMLFYRRKNSGMPGRDSFNASL